MSLLKVNEVQNYNGSSLTLTASTVSTSAQLNTGGNISVTGSINVSDDSTTRSNLGLGSIATQDSDNVTVTGGTATLGALTVSGSDSGDLVRITQTGTGNALVVEDSSPDSSPFVVNSAGNVGIGTSSPQTKLDVISGEVTFSSTETDSVIKQMRLGPRHYTNSEEPFYAFSANANSTNNSAFIGGSSSVGNAATEVRFYTAANTTTIAGTERMRIDSSGNLLVGYISSNGSYKLQVNSQIFATSSTIATSDGRYKENIQPLDDGLAIVQALNPVQFDWKAHPVHQFNREQPTVGFIAQEVQEVLADKAYKNSIIKSNTTVITPEELDEDGNVITAEVTEEFLGIAEGNLVAILTKAIQEQQSQIDALTSRIEALETA